LRRQRGADSGVFGLLSVGLCDNHRRIDFDDVACLLNRCAPGDELAQRRLVGCTSA
jgi:hypothetical protein